MQPFIIRDNEGVPLWLNNDTYTIKLDKENTGGNISIIQGFVGPGGGQFGIFMKTLMRFFMY